MATVTSVAQQPQALTFQVGGQQYAIGILNVKEIIEYDTPTRVPETPDYVAGVINLRGTVVPVVDLALRFHSRPAPITSRTCTIIVEIDSRGQKIPIGVIADGVDTVIDLTSDSVDEPPQFGTSVRADFLAGMIRTANRFMLLLDIDRVLEPFVQAAAIQEAVT